MPRPGRAWQKLLTWLCAAGVWAAAVPAWAQAAEAEPPTKSYGMMYLLVVLLITLGLLLVLGTPARDKEVRIR